MIYLFCFFQAVIFMIFIWTAPEKSSRIVVLVNADSCSSLNITIIQLFTRYGCFSLALFNHIFFCLCVSVGFLLAFLYVNSIPFSHFVTVLAITLTLVTTPFIFRQFCCIFSIFMKYCFEIFFLFWRFDVFRHFLVYSFFFNQPISFIFAPNVRHSWLRTINVFRHCGLHFEWDSWHFPLF